MKITYLGTGASEGIPSLFCCCEFCKRVIKKGGKDIRSRAGFLINDDLMIDFSADTFTHMVTNKFDLSAIKHVLITHSHDDHFYLSDLAVRMISPVIERKEESLTVFGNKVVVENLETAAKRVDNNTCFGKELKPNEEIVIGDYKIIPFKTRHMFTEDCFIYLIKYKAKTYFHMLDSDYPNEEVFEYLKEKQIKIDCVSADCTFGNMKEEYGGHMNVWENARIKQRMEEIGALDKDSKYVLTHISHYCKDTYDSLRETAEKFGMLVSYDGMQIDL